MQEELSQGGAHAKPVSNTTDVDEIIKCYMQKVKNFLSLKELSYDSLLHFEKKTKGFKKMSKNWVTTCEENPYKRHYKLRQTYVYSDVVKTRRREWTTRGMMLHYSKTSRGTVYYLPLAKGSSLVALNSHVFERFIERGLKLEKWEAFDVPRDEVMFEVVRRLSDAINEEPLCGLPLIDSDTGSAYVPVDGGYLVGTYAAYEDTTTNKHTYVTLFKTFLSHNEVSEKRMDKLLELYRDSKKTLEEFKISKGLTNEKNN